MGGVAQEVHGALGVADRQVRAAVAIKIGGQYEAGMYQGQREAERWSYAAVWATQAHLDTSGEAEDRVESAIAVEIGERDAPGLIDLGRGGEVELGAEAAVAARQQHAGSHIDIAGEH